MTGISPPPGWYADPTGAPQNRWWDGAQWQEATQEPLHHPADGASFGYLFDSSIDTWTINAWLISLTPLMLFAGSLANQALDDAVAGVVVFVLTYSILLVPIVFAFFDYRTLRERGMDHPFHWAWSFFGAIVYVIGRAVVAKQRTGHGLAPLVVFLGSGVVMIVGGVGLSLLRTITG